MAPPGSDLFFAIDVGFARRRIDLPIVAIARRDTVTRYNGQLGTNNAGAESLFTAPLLALVSSLPGVVGGHERRPLTQAVLDMYQVCALLDCRHRKARP